MNYRLFIDYLSYLFVPTFRIWKPIFYSWLLFTVLTVVGFYCVNYENKKLMRHEGIVDEFYFKYSKSKGTSEVHFNFKIANDTIIYGQTWLLPPFKIMNIFFFGKPYVPAEIGKTKKGDTIEFYIDKEATPYETLIWMLKDSKTGKETQTVSGISDKQVTWYERDTIARFPTIIKKTADVSDKYLLTTYGMKVNNKVYMDYTKRAFVSKQIQFFHLIGLFFYLILLPMFAIHLYVSIGTFSQYRKININIKNKL